ncbi:MAG UNVERIFIED_CONTAM: 3-oxoacyl-ACP reductase [Rickettsiaceae bacterium]|jgi:acetoacetyl-CoA reductase
MTKIAIVTGGTRGIGASISKALLNNGYTVIANYITNDEAAKAFAEETGIKVMKWNVSKYSECMRAVEAIEDTYGTNVEALVNNAGITRDNMLHKMSEEEWNEVIHVNLDSCFNMCRAVIGKMRDKKYGRIVNLSSINAQAGQIGQTNYSAAKAGIIGFTKALARESASKNITVNAIAPGYVMTDMVAKIPNEVLDKIVALIPMARLGRPEDISRAVMFLVSEEAGYITGETLAINGGHNMF